MTLLLPVVLPSKYIEIPKQSSVRHSIYGLDIHVSIGNFMVWSISYKDKTISYTTFNNAVEYGRFVEAFDGAFRRLTAHFNLSDAREVFMKDCYSGIAINKVDVWVADNTLVFDEKLLKEIKERHDSKTAILVGDTFEIKKLKLTLNRAFAYALYNSVNVLIK